jgi:FixJ family two-component response regulator
MPDLTGIVLSEKLLALRSDIAIILCTGHSTEVTEESAHQLGIKSFIYKPVKMEKLYSVINELK